MYEDEHLNFKNRHCSCVASASPQTRVKKKSLKLGGKEVELRCFSQIGHDSAFFINWANHLLLLQRIEKLQ